MADGFDVLHGRQDAVGRGRAALVKMGGPAGGQDAAGEARGGRGRKLARAPEKKVCSTVWWAVLQKAKSI